ncbi:NAD-dependent epimerase/dehydratase family protein [Pedobacter kyonggii]|uniref:NAD-dependent epimerase/dehydratase family protein n=1 Tax=Pedobacter kyonggii TaxID=1926871 RepID=A0A4Q9HH47_9SPHI|nr:NAD-dependent epimerase/dehydratase family protein [Pedobacter kyonggii]TBO44279.1 NAD-dependent epimerase/dehydratase family protein [Pedobacter kyonggii]
MRILVTGGAGFIGSNLLKILLADEKNEVICLDNFDDSYSRKWKQLNILEFGSCKRFTFIEGNILDKDELNKIDNIEIIIHLAAKTGVRNSIHNPAEYHLTNVIGTQNLLDLAVKKNVKQFVFSSSSSIYGDNPNTPWMETELPMPISPYACSKMECERLGYFSSKKHSLRFISLRFFTVYGPGQRPDLVIYKFFQSILSNSPIIVYGDGSSNRSYTYVDDVVSGIMKAIVYDKTEFEIINLCSKEKVNLLELITLIEVICNKKAIVEWQNEQAGDVPTTEGQNFKAEQLLDYCTKTELQIGLVKFYEWYMSTRAFV